MTPACVVVDGETMAREFECGAPNCTFLVRANDEAEIVEYVRRHARDKHDKEVDEARVRERIREV